MTTSITDKAATATKTESGNQSNRLTDQVFSTLSGITRQQPGIEQAEFDLAGMSGTHVADSLSHVLDSHEAFRLNDPELAAINRITGTQLANLETVTSTALDEIGQLARGVIREGLKQKGFEVISAVTIGSDVQFGAIIAPNLGAKDFAELQRIGTQVVSNRIAEQLEALGIMPDSSASFRALGDGLKYVTNPTEFDASRQGEVVVVTE
jgi:hypothetical protein